MTDHGWELHRQEPDDWVRDVALLGAGPFHTVLGLRATGVPGRPVYLRCRSGRGECIALCLGVIPRRRIPFLKGEILFPSVPVYAPGVAGAVVVPDLLATLKHQGIRTVRFDSFDAQSAGMDAFGTPRPRREYRVPIRAGEVQEAALTPAHRRWVAQGGRQGFVLQRLYGNTAAEAMDTVKASAAERANRKGRSFDSMGEGWDPAALVPRGETRFGGAVWAVLSDGEVLAAATVIWAGGRAFYVEGGSTPRGYEAVASHWMHIRIMAALAEEGVGLYNMGGAPAGAHDPGSPHHGLYRFKMGFGAEEVSVHGAVIAL